MNNATGGRRGLRLAVLLAATALTLAACSGGSGTPQVASLATSAPQASTPQAASTGSGTSGGSTSATQPASEVTPLLNEWAACERSNGDPGQAAPTVDANGVVWVFVPKGAQPAGDLHELTGTCSEYLAKAQNELEAGHQIPPPIPMSQTLKYVACMRANGVPDYPYPTGDTTNFNGSGVDPGSPLVQRANELCGKKLGWPAAWINPGDFPGTIEVRTAGMPANPTAPACFFQKVDPCSGDITKSGAPGAGSNG
jgi:hypothetical protein